MCSTSSMERDSASGNRRSSTGAVAIGITLSRQCSHLEGIAGPRGRIMKIPPDPSCDAWAAPFHRAIVRYFSNSAACRLRRLTRRPRIPSSHHPRPDLQGIPRSHHQIPESPGVGEVPRRLGLGALGEGIPAGVATGEGREPGGGDARSGPIRGGSCGAHEIFIDCSRSDGGPRNEAPDGLPRAPRGEQEKSE
jgi:hypothetical protein